MHAASEMPAQIGVTKLVGHFQQGEPGVQQEPIVRGQDSFRLPGQFRGMIDGHFGRPSHRPDPHSQPHRTRQPPDPGQGALQERVGIPQREPGKHDAQQPGLPLALSPLSAALEQAGTVRSLLGVQ